MESELLRYRANPTDRNFNAVFETHRLWLRHTGASTIRSYKHMTIDADLDDMISEGAFAISKAARRFIWVCPCCADPFLRREKMHRHARDVHRVRGLTGYVSPTTFVQCSARLAIRKAARKTLRKGEIISETIAEIGVDDGLEDRFAFVELLRWAKTELSEAALDVLSRILDSDSPKPIYKGDDQPPASISSTSAVYQVDSLREVFCGIHAA